MALTYLRWFFHVKHKTSRTLHEFATLKHVWRNPLFGIALSISPAFMYHARHTNCPISISIPFRWIHLVYSKFLPDGRRLLFLFHCQNLSNPNKQNPSGFPRFCARLFYPFRFSSAVYYQTHHRIDQAPAKRDKLIEEDRISAWD